MLTDRSTEPGAAAPHKRGSAVRPSILIVLCFFSGIIAFFLFTEHRAHLFRFIPYLLLFLCPLLHLVHHRIHGENHGEHSGGTRE